MKKYIKKVMELLINEKLFCRVDYKLFFEKCVNFNVLLNFMNKSYEMRILNYSFYLR